MQGAFWGCDSPREQERKPLLHLTWPLWREGGGGREGGGRGGGAESRGLEEGGGGQEEVGTVGV